jgi:hypothetical protein
VSAKPEDTPACKDKADPPITFAEMEHVARRLAADIVASQHALVKVARSSEPYMPELRKAAVLAAIVTVVAKLGAEKVRIEVERSGG